MRERTINWILERVSTVEDLANIDKADDRADIACELAKYEQRKGAGYYD